MPAPLAPRPAQPGTTPALGQELEAMAQLVEGPVARGIAAAAAKVLRPGHSRREVQQAEAQLRGLVDKVDRVVMYDLVIHAQVRGWGDGCVGRVGHQYGHGLWRRYGTGGLQMGCMGSCPSSC